jgi:hypothetical protein
MKGLLAGLILVSVASATTVIPMSVEELTRAASSVVEVDVLNSWSAWDTQHTLIYTYSRVRVAHSLKGGVQPEMIVQQLGGSSEGYTMKVAGVHALESGEHAVLFLRPVRANGGATWSIVGLMQGHFRVYTAGGKTLAGNGLQVPRMEAKANARAQSRNPVTLPSSSSSTATSAALQSSISQESSTLSEAPSFGTMTMQELESRIRRSLDQ